MPKTILANNVVLLLCFSVMAGSGVIVVLGGEAKLGRSGFLILTGVGLLCAVIMFFTEIFTGIKWVPIVALASLVYGWISMGDNEVTPRGSEIGWGLGWLSVAVWFACLSAKARENR